MLRTEDFYAFLFGEKDKPKKDVVTQDGNIILEGRKREVKAKLEDVAEIYSHSPNWGPRLFAAMCEYSKEDSPLKQFRNDENAWKKITEEIDWRNIGDEEEQNIIWKLMVTDLRALRGNDTGADADKLNQARARNAIAKQLSEIGRGREARKRKREARRAVGRGQGASART